MYMIILLLTKIETRKKEAWGKTSRIKPLSPSRPFTSSPGPLYQNKVKCSAFDIETVFHSHANETHFGLILKVKVFGTRKWPVWPNIHIYKSFILFPYMSLRNYWEKLFKEQSIFPLGDYFIYYIHFEITRYPCNLIGSQQCDLFLNRTMFCSKSHLSQIASFVF